MLISFQGHLSGNATISVQRAVEHDQIPRPKNFKMMHTRMGTVSARYALDSRRDFSHYPLRSRPKGARKILSKSPRKQQLVKMYLKYLKRTIYTTLMAIAVLATARVRSQMRMRNRGPNHHRPTLNGTKN